MFELRVDNIIKQNLINILNGVTDKSITDYSKYTKQIKVNCLKKCENVKHYRNQNEIIQYRNPYYPLT